MAGSAARRPLALRPPRRACAGWLQQVSAYFLGGSDVPGAASAGGGAAVGAEVVAEPAAAPLHAVMRNLRHTRPGEDGTPWRVAGQAGQVRRTGMHSRVPLWNGDPAVRAKLRAAPNGRMAWQLDAGKGIEAMAEGNSSLSAKVIAAAMVARVEVAVDYNEVHDDEVGPFRDFNTHISQWVETLEEGLVVSGDVRMGDIREFWGAVIRRIDDLEAYAWKKAIAWDACGCKIAPLRWELMVAEQVLALAKFNAKAKPAKASGDGGAGVAATSEKRPRSKPWDGLTVTALVTMMVEAKILQWRGQAGQGRVVASPALMTLLMGAAPPPPPHSAHGGGQQPHQAAQYGRGGQARKE